MYTSQKLIKKKKSQNPTLHSSDRQTYLLTNDELRRLVLLRQTTRKDTRTWNYDGRLFCFKMDKE